MEIVYVSAYSYSCEVELRRRDGAVFRAERTAHGEFTVTQRWASGDEVRSFPAGAADVIEAARALSVADMTGWEMRINSGIYAEPPRQRPTVDVLGWETTDGAELPY